MLREGALRKKLQEIGIPNWGNKDLMKRRHIEWLNIHNSNCDADDSVRKSKRLLLQELDEWENTQGGKAHSKDDRIMRKDFDGNGHARSHKSDFDDLIARARQKRAVPRPNAEAEVDKPSHKEQNSEAAIEGNEQVDNAENQHRPAPPSIDANDTPDHGLEPHHSTELHPHPNGLQQNDEKSQPKLRNDPESLVMETQSAIQSANGEGSNLTSLNSDPSHGVPHSQPISSLLAEEQHMIDLDASTMVP
jgi:E3 ubiquitin-protein ligase RAD18